MLLPDNIHPEDSLYYIGSKVLKELKLYREKNILEVYATIKEIDNISFSVFVLTLDWLYLIEAVEVDEKGVLKLCI